MAAKPVREQQRLVEFAGPEPGGVQGHRQDQVCVAFSRQRVNHERGKGLRQGDLPAILQ
jgi:hypothetical protein